MRIEVRTTIRAAMRDLRAKQRAIAQAALPRALNKVAAQVRTQAARELKARYGIGVRNARDRLYISRARSGNLIAKVIAEGKPFPLIAFRARDQRPRGVVVTIRGKQRRFPSAFIATMRSGHRGVFARGRYTRGRSGFQFGNFYSRAQGRKGRALINELFTSSAPQGFRTREITQRLVDLVNQKFPGVLAHEIAHALRRR